MENGLSLPTDEMAVGAHELDRLSARLRNVRARIEAAARGSNRRLEEITLVAISKSHPAEFLRRAIAAGVTDLGENRVQEAEGKIYNVGRRAARWHLVGHLQSNKARRAVAMFDVIHSLDSVSLARRLERICNDEDRERLPVLIQVDLGHEATKAGVDEKELPALVKPVTDCERLQLIGLMTMPPFFEDAERARPFFRRLRELRDELRAQGAFGDREGELSMGMTHDYPIAIEEGATMLRIGTAIFGERQVRNRER